MFVKSLFAGLMIVSAAAGVLSGVGEAWPGFFSSPQQILPVSEITFPLL
jgi:hypothetical protein